MQRKGQIFGKLKPFKPTVSSECDFVYKVRVEIPAVLGEKIKAIDRLI